MPVVGKSFFGREQLYQNLVQGYATSEFSSYLLLGDRRLGKTSFLQNFNNKVRNVKLVYMNLQVLGSCPEGMTDIYGLISYEIAQAFGLPELDEEEFNKESFERYLKDSIRTIGGLILALDEYERLQYLINQNKIPRDFPKMLIKWASIPRLGIILAGYKPLEKLGDEFNCLESILEVRRLNTLDNAEIKKILTEPMGEAIKYHPDALELMLNLIQGHPYLANIMGLILVNLLKHRDSNLIDKKDIRDAWAKVQEIGENKLLDFKFLLTQKAE
jgi:hypothetical protein